MSLFGAMNTAISGLGAQSVAFGNISDNVANAQTIGFRRTDTSFTDYLTTSTALANDPGTVVAHPDYVNSVQGTISQTDNDLGMAITGQGFFSVSHPVGADALGKTLFAAQPYFTRAGDFQLDKSGYLVNGSGEYLNGWIADSSGVLDKSKALPIQVAQTVYKPVATKNLTMAANLPVGLVQTVQEDANGNVVAMYDSANNQVSAIQPEVQIYDAQGTAHMLQYTWTPVAASTVNADGTYNVAPDSWLLDANLDGKTNLGLVQVNFNPDGTIGSIASPVAGGTSGIFRPGTAATDQGPTPPAFVNAVDGTITYDTGIAAPSGNQTVSLDLGTLGKTNGVTQFSATSFTLRGLNQDGVPPGSFSSISTRSSGDIYANYDNGQTRLIARVPVATFGDADALQRQNGNSFTITRESGDPTLQDAGSNGSGSLVTKSIEASNVDMAAEFSKLIVAQRAYSANTKVVTTADELLQQTIDMKR